MIDGKPIAKPQNNRRREHIGQPRDQLGKIQATPVVMHAFSAHGEDSLCGVEQPNAAPHPENPIPSWWLKLVEIGFHIAESYSSRGPKGQACSEITGPCSRRYSVPSKLRAECRP